jgi:nucleotide-binding universal stress UspA family protein
MAIRAVIVPMDFSAGAQRAVAPAGAVARRFDGRVVPVTSSCGWGDKDPAEALALVTAPITDVAEAPRVFDRFAPNAIVELARTTPDAIICMATQGRDGLARLIGSVAEEVLRQVGAPVLLVGPNSEADPTTTTGPIVVCLDGSDISQTILPTATDWIRHTGQSATLLSVVEAEDSVGAAHEALADAAARIDIPHADRVTQTVLHHGDPASAIITFAERERAPLIAMATHGRTGLSRLTTGSITARVTRDALCPILTRRPPQLND